MKLLVCGDIHLTNYSNFNQGTDNPAVGTRLQELMKALQYFFSYGMKNNIKYFVINGDLFDQRQRENPTTMAIIRKQINKMFSEVVQNNERATLFLNVGNHDELTRDVTPNALEDFSYYDTKHIKVINSIEHYEYSDGNLLFVPYSENIDEYKQKLRNYFDLELGGSITVFAHLGVNGAVQGRWDHRLSSAFNLEDLGWGYVDNKHESVPVTNVVLGHYHTRQSLAKENNKEAWYVGDLLGLNFNDITKDGYGAPRGFDVVDTNGGHDFIDLTKSPYNLPTFNSFDLDEAKISTEEIVSLSNKGNYVRLTLSDKEQYEKLKGLVKPENVKIVLKSQSDNYTEVKVDPNATEVELVSEYCEKHYPEIKDQALEYLRKAKDN